MREDCESPPVFCFIADKNYLIVRIQQAPAYPRYVQEFWL